MPSENKDRMFGPWNRSESSSSMYLANNNSADNLVKLYSKTAPSSPRWTPHNSPPTSPTSSSPQSTSPYATLRRNYSSTFTLIPEDRAVETPKPATNFNADDYKKYQISNTRILLRLILWWPLFMVAIAHRIISFCMGVSLGPFLLAAPTFWFSCSLWMFWKIVGMPLALIKWALITLYTPASERNRKKRTILISCGSTIQTLHLARNFYKSGARVVVFEFDGLFGLARFSTAVNKFYTIQKPTAETTNDYIAALCEVVEKENPTHYIPVCATSPAHYDALAKPHLELLGCSTFIPGAQETCVLDDILEVMKKCESYSIPLPPHQVLTSKDDLYRLYDNGWLSGFRNVMISSGLLGILERSKYILPLNKRDLKLTHDISENQKWVVIRDTPGNHYVTCTTVKDSKVIANVTCAIQTDTRALIPEHNKEIENWLSTFFEKVHLQRPINGHISFRFVKCQNSGNILPLGVRLGVSLPYICYTGVHSRVLCKPCPHFSRANSGPIVQDGGRYWIHEAFIKAIRKPSVDSVTKLIGIVLDKREALFVYWDPLPYLAYYHFQLPFKSVKIFLQKRQATRNMAKTLTAPVH